MKFYLDKNRLFLFPGIALLASIIKTYISYMFPNPENLVSIPETFAIKAEMWGKGFFEAVFMAVILASILSMFILYQVQRQKANRIRVSKMDGKSSIDLNSSTLVLTVLFIALLFIHFVAVSLIMRARIRTFSSPNYDMGIFTQMFENMRKGFGPVTTVERDRLLSHFSIHVSPAMYLFLPFYVLAPAAETLQILQILTVLSGLIPFYFIMKRMQFPKYIRIAGMILYLFTPTLTSGHSFDFHENCLLAPFLLWLILANISDWKWRSLLFTVATLLVKEDAAIYVVCIAFFTLFQRQFEQKQIKTRFVLLVQVLLPLVYFAACIYYLRTFGTGAMTGRFNNFMLPDEAGLHHVLKNILLNPSFTISTLFTFTKSRYIFIIFISMAALPLMQKKWHNYFLVIPFIVINLLSNYPYQAEFNYQYHYGSTVLLLVMSLLALRSFLPQPNADTEDSGSSSLAQIHSNKPLQTRQAIIMCFAISFSLAFLLQLQLPRIFPFRKYRENPTQYDQIHADLDKLPRDQKILTYGMYVVPLADTFELYDLFYHNKGEIDKEVDLIVMPRTLLAGQNKELEILQKYIAIGYTEHLEYSSDGIVVFSKSSPIK